MKGREGDAIATLNSQSYTKILKTFLTVKCETCKVMYKTQKGKWDAANVILIHAHT